ncbi:MAG: Maf family protein [Bacteroidota bacterium]
MKLSKNLILASNSPRRKQILSDAGFEFTVSVKEIDESFSTEIPVIEVAEYLAKKKASAFYENLDNTIILTADTIVAVDNLILNKPADKKGAVEMLKKLSGRTHVVHTGVCLRLGNIENSFTDTTVVSFKALTDSEIDYYIETCKPYDKAGAYGVQDFIGMVGIDKIEGSYFTVMGLPIHRVYKELEKYIVWE